MKIIAIFIASLIGIFISAYLLPGFEIAYSAESFALTAGAMTLVSVFIRPFVKLIFTPFIIITLGLFNLIINAVLLYVIDLFSDNLTIKGLEDLIYATLIITLINVAVNYSVKKQSKT